MGEEEYNFFIMEYSKILKNAFEATKKYKAMWLLGMFVASGSSGCVGRFPSGFNSMNFDSFSQGSDVFDAVKLVEYWWIVALVVILVFFLMIISVAFHNIAVGGMFYGAKQAAMNQSVKFNDMFRVGWKNFAKMFGLHFLVKGTLALALVCISIPLIALAFTIVGLIIVIPAAIILLFALIPVSVAVQILLMYARQYIVLQQQTIMNSLKLSWQLFKAHVGDSIVMYLLTGVIGFGITIVTVLIALIICIPFAILGFILYTVFSWAGVVAVATLGISVLLSALYIIKGISQAFMFHLWHGAFAELQ